VERLLVGEHGGGHDAERDRELAVAERRHRTEQVDREGRALRRHPELLRTHAGREHVASEDRGAQDDEQRDEEAGRVQGVREPTGNGAEERDQDEGPDSPDAGLGLRGPALLALGADECTDEERGGEVANGGEVECGGGYQSGWMCVFITGGTRTRAPCNRIP